MSVNIDSDVQVNVATSAAAVTLINFGVPLYLADESGLGGVWLYREYTDSASAQADADLTADAKAAVADLFAQNPTTESVIIGRAVADVAQVNTVTVGAGPAENDVYTVTINGVDFEFTAAAAPTPVSVAAGLTGVINAGAEPVTADDSAADGTFTLTADVPGTPFTLALAYNAAGGGTSSLSAVETTPNASHATALDDIVAAGAEFYGVTNASRAKLDIERTAGWTESNAPRFYIAQTSDSAVADGESSATNVLASLTESGYTRTALVWHAVNTEHADLAWLGRILSLDPDDGTHIAAFKTLAGITTDKDALDATQVTTIRGDDGNVFVPFHGTTVMSKGVTVNGKFIDELITLDWVDTRMTAAIAQLLLDVSNQNKKISYDDQGIERVRSTAQEVLDNGVDIGHFREDVNADGVRIPRVFAPLLENISVAARTARELTLTFEAPLAGAIQGVTVNGVIAVSL